MTPVQGITTSSTQLLVGSGQAPKITGSESFTYALNAAKGLIETNKIAEEDVMQKTIDFMTGKNDNVVDLMVAQSKSDILLQYSLQVRNGLLSAYKEIINLTV